jgi:sigma54-dependent transcription regulator
MGTATLKSIFERMVDQMINMMIKERRPIQKNGEEKTALKNRRRS